MEPDYSIPKRHFLDRRADAIAEQGSGDGDDLLSTVQVAAWLGVSPQFLEIGRCRGYGPPFVKIGPRRTRYLRSSVLEWLRSRTHASTAEYDTVAIAGPGRPRKAEEAR